jgi:tetratricopeptide (TPR) repeat protein
MYFCHELMQIQFMVKQFRLIFFVSICIFMYNCSVIPDRLKTAEELIETNPDSALHILQKTPPTAFNSDAHRALYGLLLFKTLNKKLLPLKPDSVINFSLNYYEEHHDNDRLADCYLYKGRTYMYAFQFEKAMDYYLKAMDIAQAKKDYLLLGRINSDIAYIYTSQRDYTLARKKFKLAYEYFTRLKLQDKAFNSLLDIGRTYHNAKEYCKAQQHYSTLYSQAVDSMQQGALLQEIAINYYSSLKYDSALFYFRKIIPYPYIRNNRAIRYYYLADLYFDMDQLDSARYYAENSFKYNPDIRTQHECYRILANVAYERRDTKELLVKIERYVKLGDSIRKIDAQTKGSIIEKIYSTTKDANNTRRQRLYLFGLLLFLVTVGLIVFCYLKKYSNKEKKRMKTVHLQEKIEFQKNIVNKRRITLLQQIEGIKAEHAYVYKKATPDAKEKMDHQLYNQLIHINNKENFEKEMNLMLNNMVSKLKDRYPSLTEKEITWCCLHTLNIPTIDILLLLNYKVDSLNKMKQRLAQKTKIKGVPEINCFLNNILSELD